MITTKEVTGSFKHLHKLLSIDLEIYTLDLECVLAYPLLASAEGWKALVEEGASLRRQRLERIAAGEVKSLVHYSPSLQYYDFWFGLVEKEDCLGFLRVGHPGEKREISRIATDWDLLFSVTDGQANALHHLLEEYATYLVLRGYIKRQADLYSQDFLPVYHYIKEHLDGELGAEALSTQLFIPKNALYQMARTETGSSLGAFVRDQRLEYAKELLVSTEDSVTKIAEQCGIQDFNYFSRLFRQQVGVPPLQYRKEMRGKESFLPQEGLGKPAD